MRGAVLLGAALLLSATGVAAQELEARIASLLRARGCAMEVAAVAEVFTVMGRPRAEVEAALEALAASGGARLAAGTLRLAPELCRPVRAAEPPAPVPWIEERLARAPGCRMDRAGLAAEAEAAGLRWEDFDRVAAALGALGRVEPAGGGLQLRADLCGPVKRRDWQLDRILRLGLDSYRAVLGTLALERGCRLELADREALTRDLMAEAAERLILGHGRSPDAQAALALRIGEALDDPGPGFRPEPGALVARYCLS